MIVDTINYVDLEWPNSPKCVYPKFPKFEKYQVGCLPLEIDNLLAQRKQSDQESCFSRSF